MIYRLIIQELRVEEDTIGTLEEVIDFEMEYDCRSMGFFTSIEDVKEVIPGIVHRNKTYSDGYIVNIYTRDIIEGNVNPEVDNDEFESYTFFDESGNILSSFTEELVRDSTPKFNIGDIILYIPDSSDTNEIEIGIISYVPTSTGNEYCVLLGTDLHNHSHPMEEFILKYDVSKYSYMTQTLKDRLVIGY